MEMSLKIVEHEFIEVICLPLLSLFDPVPPQNDTVGVINFYLTNEVLGGSPA